MVVKIVKINQWNKRLQSGAGRQIYGERVWRFQCGRLTGEGDWWSIDFSAEDKLVDTEVDVMWRILDRVRVQVNEERYVLEVKFQDIVNIVKIQVQYY